MRNSIQAFIVFLFFLSTPLFALPACGQTNSDWESAHHRHFANSKKNRQPSSKQKTAAQKNWQEADQRHFTIMQEMNKIESGNYASSPTGSTLTPNEINGRSWDLAIQKHLDAPEQAHEKKFELTDEYSRENMIAEELNKFRKHEFNVAYQIANYNYEEPNVMHQGGTMHGVAGSYTYRPSRGDFLSNPIVNFYRVDGQLNSMTVDYEADTEEQKGTSHFGVDDSMKEFRGLFGKEYYDKVVRVLVFSGLGYRYLLDDGGGELVYNPVGGNMLFTYDRESNYYYIPVGGEIEFPSINKWSLTLKGEYDFLVYGQQFSYLSDGDKFYASPSDDITNNQHHGYGVKGSVELARKFDLLDVYIEPFIDYWNIEESDVARGVIVGDEYDLVEPQNHTTTWGARMGVKF